MHRVYLKIYSVWRKKIPRFQQIDEKASFAKAFCFQALKASVMQCRLQTSICT